MAHHTKDKGDVAITQAIADLTMKGYMIFIPAVTEHCPFDFIAYKDGKCLRIQSKYSDKGHVNHKKSWSSKSGSHSSAYNLTDFDYYAIYSPKHNRVLYPNISFGGINIRYDHPFSATPFYWWEDFLDFTDTANKHHLNDFGIALTHRVPKITDKVIDARIKRRKVIRPTKEELNKLLWESPTYILAKQFGVSDKAIEKWAKLYCISKPPRGYWNKLRSKDPNKKPKELNKLAPLAGLEPACVH